MNINGRDVVFRMNIRATKRIAALCPGRDISKIDQLFQRDDLVEFLDNLTEIAIAMSLNKENEKPLTAEEVEDLEIEDMNKLAEELRKNFVRDKESNVTIKEIKKNEGEEANESLSD